MATKHTPAVAAPEIAMVAAPAPTPISPVRFDPRNRPPRNPATIITLQRSVGNAAVQRMLAPAPVRRTCACGGVPGADGMCDACRMAQAHPRPLDEPEPELTSRPEPTPIRRQIDTVPVTQITRTERAPLDLVQRAPPSEDQKPATPNKPKPDTGGTQPSGSSQPAKAPPPDATAGSMVTPNAATGPGSAKEAGEPKGAGTPFQIETSSPKSAGVGAGISASAPPAGGTAGAEAPTAGAKPGPGTGPIASAAAATTEGLLATLGNLPVSGLGGALSLAFRAGGAAMAKEKEVAAASVPVIPQPTGLPTGAEPLPPTLPGQPPAATTAPSPGNRAKQPPGTSHPNPTAPLPAAGLPVAVGSPPAEAGGFLAWIGGKVQGLLGNLPTRDTGVSTSAGNRPRVDLSGDASPALGARHHQEAAHELEGQRGHADAATATDFGETRIRPTVAVETLKTIDKPTPPPASAAAGSLEAPPLPADERAKFDRETAPLVHGPIHAEIAKYRAQRATYELTAKEAQATGKRQLAEETNRAKLEQESLRKQAHADISAEKGRWREENRKVEREFGSKASAKRQELDKQIAGKVQTTQTEADTKLTEAEGKARAEQAKAEAEAAAKKREEQNKPKSFWERAKDAVSDVFSAIKGALNAIFDKMRALVKTIIETAKSAVSALIEAARSAIVGMLQQFGELLKNLVGLALAAFPEIAKKFQAAIDAKIKAVVTTVNRVADNLKKAANAILDVVGKTIDAALSLAQKAWTIALSVVEAIIKAPFAAMDALAKIIAWVIKNKKILDIFKKMEQEGDKVLEQIKTKVGGMIASVPAAAQAKLKELTAPLATKGANPALATAGGGKAPASGPPIRRQPLAPAVAPAKKTPKDASDHMLGIGNALDKGLTHLKDHWWDELKKVGMTLLWPWPAVWSDIKEIWQNIKAGFKAATELKPGKVIDAVLANQQKVNSILGNLYGWFFIASVLVGAAFAGVGAAAGAAFAGAVGEALALATIGTETAIIVKSVADLAIGNDTDAEDTDDYGKIGGGILTITITALLFLLGAAAAKFAAAIWKGVAGLFKGEKPPEVNVKIEGEGKAGGETKPTEAKPGETKAGDGPEFEGKRVLGEAKTADNATIKSLEDGRMVICRTCAILDLEAEFAPELNNPAKAEAIAKANLKERLNAAKLMEPQAKAEAEVKLREELQALREGAAPVAGVPQGLTPEQFNSISAKIRQGAGHYSSDIQVHGSRAAGTAKPTSDLDVAVRVDQAKFNEIAAQRFGEPNPGSAKAKTMAHAIETGKIQSGEAGLRGLRKQIAAELGMEVDISVIKIGGPFDKGPYIPLK